MPFIDHQAKKLRSGDQSWTPTKGQWIVVATLSARPGWVFSREQLLTALGTECCDDTTVDSFVKHIRRAFRERGWSDPIEGRYGLGYVWREDQDKSDEYSVSLNSAVKIQMTDRGRAIHRSHWEARFATNGIEYTPLIEDADGYAQLQLWQVMQIFGPFVGDGFGDASNPNSKAIADKIRLR